jgi:hypothetical protein
MFRFWLAAVLGCAGPLNAAELSVNGFGTIGAAYLDKPAEWAYTRSLNQRPNDDEVRADLDSVVGLQLNYSPTAEVELVGQATASLLNKDADASDYLGLAFIAWRPDPRWSLRLGRVNLDAYLISEHRDVGFTHQFIRPPVEFYSRMPTSLDGGDVERSWEGSGAHWRVRAFAGRTSAGIGRLRMNWWPLFGVVMAREADGLLLRLSALRARTPNGLVSLDPLVAGLQQMQALPVPQVAAEAAVLERAIATRGLRTRYVAAALAYDRHDWLLVAELNRARARDSSALNFTSGYISIGRRFGALSAFVMESMAVRDQPTYEAPDWATPLAAIDPVLAQQAQALALGATTAANKSAGEQSTTSAGLRWDVAPRLALKAQFDHVRTRRDGDGLWLRADGRRTSANVLAVALDFVF